MLPNTPDREIFERITQSDDRALKLLFDRYYVPLCRAANLYLSSPDVAEEIVQDLFVSLWENRESIQISLSVKSYLYSSVRNRSLNYIRDNKRFESLDILEEFSENEDDFSIFELKELEELLAAAIESLPEKCQNIFRMSREQDLTIKKIAELEGISPKTVENQITIALKKIRQFMKDYYFIISLVGLLK